jgi:hypothetical protein
MVGRLQSTAPGSSNAARTGTINLDSILKLIPGDVISLYIAGSGLAAVTVANGAAAGNTAAPAASDATQLPANWVQIVFWLCFLVCAVVRIVATRPVGETGLSLKGVNWSLLVATLVAFFIWAHAVSAVGPIIPWLHGAVAAFIAMVFGVVAPLFVKAE